MTIILLVCFFLLLLLNVPIAFCMLLSSLAALLWAGINPIMVGLETARSLACFYTFLAVPFFILAGEIMSYGGLSKRLVDLAKSIVGHLKTGLPVVTTISSQLFGAVSGASAATCAAVDGVMIPAMGEAGVQANLFYGTGSLFWNDRCAHRAAYDYVYSGSNYLPAVIYGITQEIAALILQTVCSFTPFPLMLCHRVTGRVHRGSRRALLTKKCWQESGGVNSIYSLYSI